MEYDCGDFDRRIALPGEHTYCTDEVASHSYAGVGADPSLRYNLYGGEVQFAPATSERQLLLEVLEVLHTCLRGDLHHPGSLHMHMRVPALLERPDLVKKIVLWTDRWWPILAPYIYRSEQPDNCGRYNAWLYQCNWDVKTLTYPRAQLEKMMAYQGDDVAELARVLHNHPTDWKNEWHQDVPPDRIKRPAVNFGHLAINGTIEFRCFITTVDPTILWNIICFPRNFLTMAVTDYARPMKLVKNVKFQERPYKLHDFNGLAESTSGYFTDIRRGISVALVNGDIGVEDLGAPEYWVSRGFQ